MAADDPERVSDDAMEALAQARVASGDVHGMITPDAQRGHWVIECVCGWSYESTDCGAQGEREVYAAIEQHIAAPSEVWPQPGDEVLVRIDAYTGGGGSSLCWCRVTRVLPAWSAGVFPVKVQIPNRGEGQFKRSEIEDYRPREA